MTFGVEWLDPAMDELTAIYAPAEPDERERIMVDSLAGVSMGRGLADATPAAHGCGHAPNVTLCTLAGRGEVPWIPWMA